MGKGDRRGVSVTRSQHERVTRREYRSLREEVVRVRKEVDESVPDDLRDEALQQVDDLAATLSGPDGVDGGIVSRVFGWFRDHLPALATSIRTLILLPVVGKLVDAGGDTAATEFRSQLEAML